jgi:hypothetical protein
MQFSKNVVPVCSGVLYLNMVKESQVGKLEGSQHHNAEMKTPPATATIPRPAREIA